MIAYYSSLAMVTSAVLYLVAMIAHAAEWAAARDCRDAPMPVRRWPGARPASWPAAEPRRRTGGDAAGRTARPRGPGVTRGRGPTHVAGVVLRGMAADRAPWGNMYEFITTSLAFVGGRLPGARAAVAACAGWACR